MTKDSKYLFATATTKGIKIFDCTNGDLLAELDIPGIYVKQVELSYSDKQFAVIYEAKVSQYQRDSFIRVFNTQDALEWGKQKGAPQHAFEVKGPKDHQINCVKWGALDKTLYYCTDGGRLLRYDIGQGKVIKAQDVNKHEIFTISITRDFTMLTTASRDGTSKLLHPETFDEIRSFEFKFPCRNAQISPLFESKDQQKFHILLCGG